MLQDFRYAARLLRRNPLFALTAALSLAIGIGANTAIFTIANALLFRPPAGVVAPGRLVDVGRSQDGQGFDNSSYPNYLDIRARNTVFDGIYAYRFEPEPMSLGGGTGSNVGAERIFGGMTTLNYFTVLGTRPHIGRLFASSDSEVAGRRTDHGSQLRVLEASLRRRSRHHRANVDAERTAVHRHRRDARGISRDVSSHR